MQNEKQKNSNIVLTVEREFDAPIQLVFDALSNPDSLAQWWGPAGYIMTVVKFEFKPKGLCLFKMENEDGLMWARFIYREIKSPELVEFVLSFSDENSGITRAPFFENWPLEILNVITLNEQNGKTTITNNSSPLNATKEEIASFNENKLSFKQGTSASMERLKLLLMKNEACAR
jgi:uncharacterized protein YndB with AHSA1/START domain